jgi:hypothetical protein
MGVIGMDGDQEILSPKYRDAARASLWLQVPLGVISILMLDGGGTAKVFAVTLAGFWLSAFLLAFRRAFSPTTTDLMFWRWGFLPCFVLAHFVAQCLERI